MTVRETIRLKSEGDKIKRGIYRDFPVRYRDNFGNRYVVGFNVLEILRDGNPEPYHTESISNGTPVYSAISSSSTAPGSSSGSGDGSSGGGGGGGEGGW